MIKNKRVEHLNSFIESLGCKVAMLIKVLGAQRPQNVVQKYVNNFSVHFFWRSPMYKSISVYKHSYKNHKKKLLRYNKKELSLFWKTYKALNLG